MLGLIGATGYTGRLVAAELTRRGVKHRLGGRSPERLEAMPGPGERMLVELDEASSLESFLDGLDAVISCAGPFASVGQPVVDAAVRAGVPYVDSSGELDFIRAVLARHAGAASPVVPAAAFDYLPGDLAVAVAAEGLGGPAEQVLVGYRLHGVRPSRGTARSAAGVLAGASVHPSLVSIDFPDGAVSGLQVPWGEELLVPGHLPGVPVRCAVAMSGPVGALARHAAPLLAPAGALAAPLLPKLSPLLVQASGWLPEGPAPQARARSRFQVLVDVRGGGRRSQVLVEGSDIYRLSAVLLAEAALRVATAGPGAQAPAQAFPAAPFLDAVSGELLSWRRL